MGKVNDLIEELHVRAVAIRKGDAVLTEADADLMSRASNTVDTLRGFVGRLGRVIIEAEKHLDDDLLYPERKNHEPTVR